jgi:hypothetical protein
MTPLELHFFEYQVLELALSIGDPKNAENKKDIHIKYECLFLFRTVEPKGFEPLSSCAINYAFYMLIFHFIFGISRAGNLP